MTIVLEVDVGDDDVVDVGEAEAAIDGDVAAAAVDGLVAEGVDALGVEADLAVDGEDDPPALFALEGPPQRAPVAAAAAAPERVSTT